MWPDEVRDAARRVARRRRIRLLGLGTIGSLSVVAVLLSLIPPALAGFGTAFALLGVLSLFSLGPPLEAPTRSTQELEGAGPSGRHASDGAPTPAARLGRRATLRADSSGILYESPLEASYMRIEDLAWVYPVRHRYWRWHPFVHNASVVLKRVDGSELVLACFPGQTTAALSAIRKHAEHVAMGWSRELADSWRSDRTRFVGEVRARAGGGAPQSR